MINFLNTINTIFFFCMFAITFDLYLSDIDTQFEFSALIISATIDTLFEQKDNKMVKIKLFADGKLIDSSLLSKKNIEFYFIRNAIRYIFDISNNKKNKKIASKYKEFLNDLAIKSYKDNNTANNLHTWLTETYPLTSEANNIKIFVSSDNYDSYKIDI